MGVWTNEDPIPLVHFRPPVTQEDLARLTPDRRMIQFSDEPEPWVLPHVAHALAERPETVLRVLGGRDLGYLAEVPAVRRLILEVQDGQRSLDGLRHAPEELEELTLHTNERASFSLAPLARFRMLRELSLERLGNDIEVLGELTTLETLKLRSVPMADLSALRPLERLATFELRLGGTSDLTGLESLRSLRYLEIWRVRGLEDLSAVAALESLETLFLQALGRVTELPDLSRCRALRVAQIETLKSLTDLRGLARSPALTDLLLLDMPQLRWEHIEPFAGHPALERARIGTGSFKRNDELSRRLGLPDVF